MKSVTTIDRMEDPAALRRMFEIQSEALALLPEAFPAIDTQAWQSVVAPKGTPAAVVDRLNAEISRYLDLPESRAQLLRMGV